MKFHKSENINDVINNFKIVPHLAVEKILIKLKSKDILTYEHCLRVGFYAKKLAESLNYNPKFTQLIYESAILHDIGKYNIPNSILTKPSKLTDEEFTYVKKHPEYGVKIFNSLLEDLLYNEKDIDIIRKGILYHHERPDGKGYPLQLSDNDIPDIAKIISVVDAFDAMTEDRSYRKGMDTYLALNQLKNNKDSQFNNNIVNAFERLIIKDLSLV